MNSDQEELPLETPKAATAPAAEAQLDADLDAEGETGPFDAPAATPRLALPSGAPTADEIPEADFEFVADDLDESAPVSEEAFSLDDDPEDDEDADASLIGAIGGDPLSPDARDAWLNEPLRTSPEDAAAADDDLTS